MIFTRTSHTLLFAAGILLLVAMVADERGTLGTVAAEAQTDGTPQGEVQLANSQRPATADYVEEAVGWDDEPVIDDAEFFDSGPPDVVEPDNTFDEVLDPSQHAMDPAPVDDDW
ncbi:hypothetical protein M3P36_13840 [Altererythrobacter sp. KTW20L]|uniref:hypothetical protein n=1 Tax=Altererythrobacter sp. KTW20L TaxID=2942210 RepID=UPI0020BD8BA4|nr:hypothetical protein [Altererythrobacter sp. KTW20L]MCL6252122.1 hypothetical protein [Altererythrobacter sp. KTW20L]